MDKLRAVEYIYRTNYGGVAEVKNGVGKFHTWGQRGDETGSEFFGVVEKENGQCIELDPSQIKFIGKE